MFFASMSDEFSTLIIYVIVSPFWAAVWFLSLLTKAILLSLRSTLSIPVIGISAFTIIGDHPIFVSSETNIFSVPGIMFVWVYSLFGVFVVPFPFVFALLFVPVPFWLLFVFMLVPVFVPGFPVLSVFDVPLPFSTPDAGLGSAFWLLLSLFSFGPFSCSLFSSVFSLTAFSVFTFSIAAVELLLFLM